MKYLDLELQNMGPLRIADDDTSQHGQVNTLSYIPGSTVRGLVIHSLSREEDFSEIKKILFSDQIHFLNLYLKKDGRELIPSLKGFYEDKTACEGKKPIENVVTGEITPGTKRASLGRYCCPEGDCIRYGEVELGEDMNINRGREAKKNVFRSQYIQKNQHFAGGITFDDTIEDAMVERIRQVFSGLVYIGNSRYSGYGACRCLQVERRDGIPFDGLRKAADRSRFYLVLLSNLCMENAYGEPVGLDLGILAEKLGCSGLRLLRCSSSTVEVFGYNRSWNGPVPSVTMYEAGSVFCIETKGGEMIPAARFRKLEEEGLGIRRNEGFGQVLFYNGYEALKYKQPLGDDTQAPGQETILPDSCRMETEDLRIAAKGLLVFRLERAMKEYLVKHPLKLPGISGSKLGVVQSLCLELRYAPREAEQKLKDYIRHSEEKDQRSSRHNGKAQQDALHQYVTSMLDQDLLERLHVEGKVLGLEASRILTEEEMIRYRLQLMIDQIRYANREVKKYAD